MAYKKLLNIKRVTGAGSSIKGDSGESGENVKPKTIPGPKLKFIAANERYLKYVRGQSIETVSFDIALIYFHDANQFDEPSTRFRDIAENKA